MGNIGGREQRNRKIFRNKNRKRNINKRNHRIQKNMALFERQKIKPLCLQESGKPIKNIRTSRTCSTSTKVDLSLKGSESDDSRSRTHSIRPDESFRHMTMIMKNKTNANRMKIMPLATSVSIEKLSPEDTSSSSGRDMITQKLTESTKKSKKIRQQLSVRQQKNKERVQRRSQKLELSRKQPCRNKKAKQIAQKCNERRAPMVTNPELSSLINCWVSHVLDKSIDDLKSEFHELKYSTIPKLEEIKEFSKNSSFNRNRYTDVPCLDRTRVKLIKHPEGNDYIHANYVATSFSNKRFICTQAPLDSTIYDFWFMVIQEQVQNIVMLCDFVEKLISKCAHYFPQNENESLTLQDIFIICASRKDLKNTECILIHRTLLVIRGNIKMNINHYQWSGWPDRDVPKIDYTPLQLLQMIRLTTKPIVVHCSAGIGRTGTIVTIEYILEQLQLKNNCENMVNVLKELRKQRAGLVQTESQYLYIHKVLLIYFTMLKYVKNSDKIQFFIHNYEQQSKVPVKE